MRNVQQRPGARRSPVPAIVTGNASREGNRANNRIHIDSPGCQAGESICPLAVSSVHSVA